MTLARVWLENNTMVIELADLKDQISNLVIPDATVIANILGLDGLPVTDGADIDMPHVSGGTYRVNAPDTIVLPLGVRHTVVISADAAGAADGEWRLPIYPTQRTV